MLKQLIISLIFLFFIAEGVDNGLGLTPQMGWNTWNRFGCDINETLIKKSVDLLISKGLAAKGYNYMNLDDCWQISRDPVTKQIIEDKTKFPSGIQALVDYVHSKNLKFGLYSDAGEKTCEGRPGSLGYETRDANTYAKWEVDYLKYDNCYNQNISGKVRYYLMHKALNQSGRHIFYSMCNWGQQQSWTWAGPYANSWRTTGDIKDNWKSWTSILDQQIGLQVYAGKGGWNDPDMLEVGNGGMKDHQYYAHFIFWCILKAPLLIGCSLENISNKTLQILGNEELIAINQDSLGIQAARRSKTVSTEGTIEVWGGQLSNSRYVVVFFNRGESRKDVTVSLRDTLHLKYKSYSVRDVINHKDIGIMTNDILTEQKLDAHTAAAYVLKIFNQAQSTQIQVDDD